MGIKMPLSGRFPVVPMALAVAASGLLLSGCMSSKDTDIDALALASQTEPADALYNQGLANLENGRLKEAAAKFEAIDRQHPYSEFARKALVMRAFASYRTGDYDEAVASARRYLSLYPGSEDAAYAQYIIGLSYYRQMPDVTRDQTDTARAVQAMQEVVDRYPDSEYAEDARTKLRIARDQLAGKEMQVGRYYQERREYIAAINRFKNVVDTYPGTRHVEEALARLTETYYAMGLTQEAQASASVLGQNFPESEWYRDSYALLQSNGLQPRSGSGTSWFSNATRLITGADRSPTATRAQADATVLAPPARG
ncbi:outer membrane protein assembly factor BamD [Aureimonas phyllosphaerae]|uniref:Outer membrane protein assembly factor BamD n=1 Tax=Aureimonas phyllosphaerae TaxID=1166078 RepID=A0A7W6BLW1_9HYPH|nr:outer membrane protein assembly factor BamD [Aureimonas phyllosphaerae]MBB3934369.1 outer membrane protein assembly factor BamD [Aureimonas phyllosphaerae]MBB3958415.1 outer membrane protein assembly factor BamD [Aureimonas phyllosphaerae]SFE96659.1 Beta-barrel assembly machine subunit BamD [Aureimonas phyllosphaerae]